jgi:flagellar motility protein MotE (MotC chaperone)
MSRSGISTASPRSKWRTAIRPSLLSLTAAAVGVSAVTHAMTATSVVQTAPPPPPPTRLGVSIQQSLAERDQEIAKRMRAAALREQSARATEQRLKADVEARQTQADPQGKAPAPGGPAPQPIQDLAHIYQTMKPARAAPIFAALDIDIQTQVARQMRERAVAQIMANMDPLSAVRLSMALAGRKPVAVAMPQLPSPDPRPALAASPSRSRPNMDYAANDRITTAADGRPTTARPRIAAVTPPRVSASPPSTGIAPAGPIPASR